MEQRAPCSRVVRARERMWGGVVGEGIRALRVRSSCLAVVRREVVLEGGGRDWSWWRVDSRVDVDEGAMVALVWVVSTDGESVGYGCRGIEEGVIVERTLVRKVMIWKLLRRALMPRLNGWTRKVCRKFDLLHPSIENAMI